MGFVWLVVAVAFVAGSNFLLGGSAVPMPAFVWARKYGFAFTTTLPVISTPLPLGFMSAIATMLCVRGHNNPIQFLWCSKPF